MVGVEVCGEGEGDERPLAVLLVPAIGGAPCLRDAGVVLGVQSDAAVGGGGDFHDAVGDHADGLGDTPGRMHTGSPNRVAAGGGKGAPAWRSAGEGGGGYQRFRGSGAGGGVWAGGG